MYLVRHLRSVSSVSKRRGRKRAPNPLLPLLLILIALVAGWYLLRPLSHAPRTHETPVVAQTQAPVATQTPEQTPEPTSSPSASAEPTHVGPAGPTLAPTAAPGGPKIALIIDDCGQWLPIERGFIALDVPITLSVLPHVHGTATIAQEAHDAGKGVMLHLPMETLSGMYPGPGEVKTSMTDAQVQAQVRDDLDQVPLAEGVNNHEGSKASADERVMRDVMQVMNEHHDLFFIDSRTNAASVGAKAASDAGIPNASRDVFLDNQETVAYTEAQLRDAAEIAKRNGSAIAIGHPKPTTLAAIRAMIPQLQSQGITFVLASSLTH
jgi:polysaccharide deacetylase 2 family uncharacterized protein YibQ